MKICASSICWPWDSLDSMLEKTAACGFRHVEVLTFPPQIFELHGNLNRMKPAELRAKLDANGLELAALHLGAILTSTPEKRRELTDYCKRAIDFATELGCGMIVEGSPDRAGEKFHPYLRSLEELCVYLEGTNVRIGLENHHGAWLQFIPDYEVVFDLLDCPQLGITLDTGHFDKAGVDPETVARKFGRKIFHVHVKDHDEKGDAALGTGWINNIGMIRTLKQLGYDGFISQELEIGEQRERDYYAMLGHRYMRWLAEFPAVVPYQDIQEDGRQ